MLGQRLTVLMVYRRREGVYLTWFKGRIKAAETSFASRTSSYPSRPVSNLASQVQNFAIARHVFLNG